MLNSTVETWTLLTQCCGSNSHSYVSSGIAAWQPVAPSQLTPRFDSTITNLRDRQECGDVGNAAGNHAGGDAPKHQGTRELKNGRLLHTTGHPNRLLSAQLCGWN